jgi:Helix-turn-helix domain
MGGKPPNIAPEEILSGWKDIARYLGKGVRTVQRYAHEQGLPVRWVSRHRGGAVIARKSDLESWISSSATGQESFNRNTRALLAYLSTELAKGPGQRALQDAVTAALRAELKTDVRNIKKSLAKLQRRVNDFQRRQDSIAWMLKRYSKALTADVKHRKPN